MKLHAIIQFKTTPNHKYHEEGKLFTYDDTYTFYNERDIDDCKQVVKEDMLEVVTYDGLIEIIDFTIKEVV